MLRDYPAALLALTPPPQGDREALMRAVVNALWPLLNPAGVSWLGFYLFDGQELILGPRRDKPACSPIGLHGACGRCLTSGRPMIVTDVANLGAGYIACDPRDRSEVVLPLFEPDGTAYAVLDLDSFDTHAFTPDDVKGLTAILEHTGLSSPRPVPPETDTH